VFTTLSNVWKACHKRNTMCCEMLSKSKSSSWSGGVSGGVSKGRLIHSRKSTQECRIFNGLGSKSFGFSSNQSLALFVSNGFRAVRSSRVSTVFLQDLKTARHKRTSTRNVALSAVHSFRTDDYSSTFIASIKPEFA